MNHTLSTFCKWVAACISLMGFVSVYAQTGMAGLDLNTEIRPFAAAMQDKYDVDAGTIASILVAAQISTKVLESIHRPAEAMMWRDYRKIFLTPKRIDGGVKFMRDNADILRLATNKYSVPEEIITAILGIETFYGKYTGKIRVLDALSTLGFRYPKRGKFFRSELVQYLLLVTAEGLNPLKQLGSYAGAMGIPQFIPSSYRNYAVDFDNDQVRDLLNSKADSIGSVANYLARHGWSKASRVTERFYLNERDLIEKLKLRGIKPHTLVSDLVRDGASIKHHYADDVRASVIALNGQNGEELWLGLNNFYVITRYNHSPLYAMAVYQLAAVIRAKISS